MEITGLILMAILIALSNAGGLSGAGSNIPLMLIFFNMNMTKAVPVSAFVAVSATVFRFIKNFNVLHPKDGNKVHKRCEINYEIVEVTMPFVFLGSLLGVELGKLIGPSWQMVVFGVTVTWSIITSY